MATTSSSGLRYPVSSDSPNIAQYFQNLANDVDQKVSLIVANPTARLALTGTYAMQIVKETSTGRIYMRNLANSGWDYAGGAPPPAVACSAVAGWTLASGRTPVVYKDASGLVHIQGAITPQSAYNPNDGGAHTALTVPVGYRPAVDTVVAANCGGFSVSGAIRASDGVLNFNGGSANSAVPINTAHWLDGIAPWHPGYAGAAIS